jgi:hypothetical protein
MPIEELGRGQLLFGESKGPKEVSNPHHLFFGQVAISVRAKGDGFTLNRHGPIASVRLVNFTETR